MSAIAERIAAHGGAGLFLDYGHIEPGLGDTFQAVRRHRSEGVFDNPGEADLTSHVDFAALAAVARSHGLHAELTTPSGISARLGPARTRRTAWALGDEATRAKITADVERLAGPGQMGELFKVLKMLPKHPADMPAS